MNSSILLPFRLSVHEKNLGVYAVRVFKKGEGEVFHFFRSDDKVNLYSGSKTFTALAVGICRDRGLLRLSDTVLSYFPEFLGVASAGSEDITLRHLLQMASGKNEFLFAGPPERQLKADWAELFFVDPQKVPAGSEFFYSNTCTYMLGRVVEKVTGQTLRDFLVPELFDPLGIDNPQWHTCPRGHTIAATELFLTNAEYSRLGVLLLEGGVYNGHRVVSEAYVREMHTDMIDNSKWDDPESKIGYGFQVWRCSVPGAYRADGMYGQFCVVLPQQQAVVTVTSHEEKKQNDILRVIYQDIVPLLSMPTT